MPAVAGGSSAPGDRAFGRACRALSRSADGGTRFWWARPSYHFRFEVRQLAFEPDSLVTATASADRHAHRGRVVRRDGHAGVVWRSGAGPAATGDGPAWA